MRGKLEEKERIEKAKGKAQKAKGQKAEMSDRKPRRDLEQRLIDYGARIVKLVAALPNTIAGRRMGDQLLRCGTSAGANYQEAQAAESKGDFIHKLQITLKEVRESTYWLRVIARSETLPPNLLASIIKESEELRAILSKAVATAKGKSRS